MAEWIKPLKVIICAGTGGVGKTTVAASLGLLAAQEGRRVLVLTIDPARRLADALGLKPQSQEQKVNVQAKGELYAAMVEPEAIFVEFVRRSAPSQEVAERLLKNRLFREMASTLNGSQEFTSLERLLLAIEDQRFDLVVLDTPPTHHAMDFLRAPERIFALFQTSVTRWFIERDGAGWLQKILQTGTKTAFGALEKVTGSGFLAELSEFFSAAAALQERVASRSIAVHRLLAQPDTGFVLVTAFDEAKLHEAMEFATDLEATGHHLKAIVINRGLPAWLKAGDRSGLAGGDEGLQRLNDFYEKLVTYFTQRERGYAQMLSRLHSALKIVKVPEEKESIDGIEGLERIVNHLRGGKA